MKHLSYLLSTLDNVYKESINVFNERKRKEGNKLLLNLLIHF